LSVTRLLLLAERAFIACVCLSGISSAATPELPQPDATRGQLILIRTSSDFGQWVSAKVVIDGQRVTKLADARYTIIPIEPGSHKIKITLGVGGVDADLIAEAGNQYVWQFTTEKQNVNSAQYEVTWLIRIVPPELVPKLLAPCKYQPIPVSTTKKKTA
jgi:hypothetical protein